MTNISRDARLIAEINVLFGQIAELSPATKDALRAPMKAAWLAGEFGPAAATEFTKTLRSELSALRTAKKVLPAEITEEVVPEGRYALDGTGKNETVFYVVKWWTGRDSKRRASVYLQISDDEQRIDFKLGLSVLRRIAEAGAKEASIRYGKALKVCGRCGKTLTDDRSRAAGIGPICASRF